MITAAILIGDCTVNINVHVPSLVVGQSAAVKFIPEKFIAAGKQHGSGSSEVTPIQLFTLAKLST